MMPPVMREKISANTVFLGIIVGVAAVQFVLLVLFWRQFSRISQGGDEVFESLVSSSTTGPDVLVKVASEALTFSFVVPRGEAVKFMEIVGPRLQEVAAPLKLVSHIDLAHDDMEVISRVESGRVFVGAVSAGLYARSRATHKIRAFLERAGKTPKQTFFLVRKDRPFSALEDLKGCRLAFKSRESVSGYLIPKMEIQEKGFKPEEFIGQEVFSGNLENSILGVLQGEYDAAAVSSTFYEEMEKDQQARLKIIHRSKPVPGGVYIASANADQEKLKTIIAGFGEVGKHFASHQELAGLFAVKPPDESLYDVLPEGDGEGDRER